MKNIFILSFLLPASSALLAQSVGINTTVPEYTLHVRDTSLEAGVGINATGISNHAIVNLSIDSRINGNSLFLLKYRVGVSGTIAGISKSNLAALGADAGAGPLLISTNQNSNMYFATNNTQRMMISGAGHVGINNNNPQSGWLHAETNDNTPAIFALSNGTGTTSIAINAFGNGTNGIGVAGVGSYIASSAYIQNSYGVLGTSAVGGVGVGGFTTGANGVGVWAEAGQANAYALYTYGKIQMQNNGEAAGKVLTSDAAGNASWQNIPAGAWSYNGADIYNNNSGNVGIGVNPPTTYAKLHVRRFDNISVSPFAERGAVYGENGSTNNGSGVMGVSFAAKGSAYYYAGVTGLNSSTATDMYGVAGFSTGVSSGGTYSAGVGGFGDYGLVGASSTSTGAGVLAQNSTGKTALQIDNGFIKVSGTNKTAFKHNTTAGNISGDYTSLSYDSPTSNDIIIITHNYSPNATYLNKAIGVFWTGSTWAIYNDDLSAMTAGLTFNVLVIKQ